MITEEQAKKLFTPYRMLTFAEKKYLEDWNTKYCYDIDIVKLAMESSKKQHKDMININHILVKWHEKGFKTIEEIEKYLISKDSKELPIEQRFDFLEKRVKELEDIIRLHIKQE